MVFTLHCRGLFLCLFIKRIFLVRTLCDHYLHKVFTRVWKSRQGQSMSAMELYDLCTHEDKSLCRLTRPALSLFDPFTLSSRAHCPPLSRCPRPCPAVHAPQPSPDHTTRPAPLCASLCASTRAPDAAPLSRCTASHTPRPPYKPLQAPVSVFTPSPRVLYHHSPRTRPERPRTPPVSLATRAHTPQPSRAPVHLCTL